MPAGIDLLHHPVTVPIPRLSGVPTVSTVYDLQHREMPGLFSRAERAYRRWAYEGAARKADLVLTTSEYSRSRLVEIAGVADARVFSVPMGIDHDRFRQAGEAADERRGPRAGPAGAVCRLSGEPVAVTRTTIVWSMRLVVPEIASFTWC